LSPPPTPTPPPPTPTPTQPPLPRLPPSPHTLSPPLHHERRTPFVAWTGEPYWNLSNAVFGFAARSPLASFVLACGLAHALTAGPHAFIPDIAGPSFFTTAVRQAVESSGVEERGSGHAHTRARARAHTPLVGHAAAAHHPSPPLVRLLPQPLFISGAAVGGVGPFTWQSNDYNWRE